MDAPAQGSALVPEGLASWAAPGAILIGRAATGPRWEPLDETWTPAGYQLVRLSPRQTAA